MASLAEDQRDDLNRERASIIKTTTDALVENMLADLKWQIGMRHLNDAAACETVREQIKGECRAMAANVWDRVIARAIKDGVV